MGKILCLMGKSGSGKDTLAKLLLEDKELNLEAIVPYTTRPVHDGEVEGVDYYFVDEDYLIQHRSSVIEARSYETANGVWVYCTLDDGKVWIDGDNYYLTIGTPNSFESLRNYFGDDRVYPLYIEVEDGLRLSRALDRERSSSNPDYCELCRRFLADDKDFKRLKSLGVKESYPNIHIADCYLDLRSSILEVIKNT